MAARRAERRRSNRIGSDQRWMAIVQAGSRVFHRLGYAQTTLEDVAREVGINRASLYYYVADKQELLIAILDAPVRRMTNELRAIAALDLTPGERLHRAIGQHVIAFDESHPDLFVFLSENLPQLRIESGSAVQTNALEYRTVMNRLIEQGIEAGDFRSDVDPRLALLGLLGMLNWSYPRYASEGTMTLREIGEQFAAIFLDGLRRR